MNPKFILQLLKEAADKREEHELEAVQRGWHTEAQRYRHYKEELINVANLLRGFLQDTKNEKQ